jgi:hypothetical protein
VLQALARALVRTRSFAFLRAQWQADLSASHDSLKTELRSAAATIKEIRSELQQTRVEQRELLEQLRRSDREARKLRATVLMNADGSAQRYAQALDANAVAGHVARSVAAAAVDPHPTPHIVIDSLFPADTYEALLAGIPPDIFFTQKDRVKQDLKIAPGDAAPEWTRRTRAFLEDEVIPRMLVPALMARLRPDLAATPHEATAGRMMLRRPGYVIKPHLDPQRAVITCLIYLARPGDDEAYGTQLFTIDEPPSLDRTSTFYPEEHGYRCELVKTVPFRANTAFAFVNAGAAHGAEIPVTAPKDLERYAYQFYVSPRR